MKCQNEQNIEIDIISNLFINPPDLVFEKFLRLPLGFKWLTIPSWRTDNKKSKNYERYQIIKLEILICGCKQN